MAYPEGVYRPDYIDRYGSPTLMVANWDLSFEFLEIDRWRSWMLDCDEKVLNFCFPTTAISCRGVRWLGHVISISRKVYKSEASPPKKYIPFQPHWPTQIPATIRR